MSWHGRTHVFTVEIFCIETVWPTCVQETHYTIQNKKKKEQHWRQACAPTRSKASTVEGVQLEKVCCSSTAVHVRILRHNLQLLCSRYKTCQTQFWRRYCMKNEEWYPVSSYLYRYTSSTSTCSLYTCTHVMWYIHEASQHVVHLCTRVHRCTPTCRPIKL